MTKNYGAVDTLPVCADMCMKKRDKQFVHGVEHPHEKWIGKNKHDSIKSGLPVGRPHYKDGGPFKQAEEKWIYEKKKLVRKPTPEELEEILRIEDELWNS